MHQFDLAHDQMVGGCKECFFKQDYGFKGGQGNTNYLSIIQDLIQAEDVNQNKDNIVRNINALIQLLEIPLQCHQEKSIDFFEQDRYVTKQVRNLKNG